MDKITREDEAQLIERSQNGDLNAFNELVLFYQPIVYNLVSRMIGDPDTASDVAQDAFLSAFRNIHTFRGGTSFRAWLLRIASNLACDHWRRVQRHPSESLDSFGDEDEPYNTSALNTLAVTELDENPEAFLLNQELQDLIQHGLEQLPLDQRLAVVLCDIQGLSYEEIAASTQTTLGTVRSRIARGRARLRAYLARHEELLPRRFRPYKDRS